MKHLSCVVGLWGIAIGNMHLVQGCIDVGQREVVVRQ